MLRILYRLYNCVFSWNLFLLTDLVILKLGPAGLLASCKIISKIQKIENKKICMFTFEYLQPLQN